MRGSCPRLRHLISHPATEQAMVKRYLKSQLLVLLFGGLVGPIFLIIYFVFETPFDRQSTQWMWWAGLGAKRSCERADAGAAHPGR
jgi:hypothetical protein